MVKYESGWIDHTSPTIDFKIQSFLDQDFGDGIIYNLCYIESLGWNVKIEYLADDCFYLYS